MKKYKSKIGTEFVILLFGALLIPLIMILLDFNWTDFCIISLCVLFLLHLIYATEYKINEEVLIIKCSFLINESINIHSIKKISETNNLLSSPAFSMDRIELLYNKYDMILLSPKEKLEFIENLKNINTKIEIKLKVKK